MFWFLGAILIGSALAALVIWVRNSNIKVAWYEWLVGAIGLLLIVGATQHYFGSLRENFLTAGWMGALSFGVPGLILLAVAWQLVARRQRAG